MLTHTQTPTHIHTYPIVKGHVTKVLWYTNCKGSSILQVAMPQMGVPHSIMT